MSACGGATRLLLTLASVVFAILLVESALRVAPSLAPPGDLRNLHDARPDRPWLYGLRPGAVVRLALEEGTVEYAINADGFRDHRYSRAKPSETLRVLLLGDSVAFGFKAPMRATFAKQLERRLRRERAAEVLNFSVGGYNPYNEAALFAELGERYEPDLVLVQFCINDLNDPTLHFDAQTRLVLGSIPDAAYPDPSRKLGPPDSSVWNSCGSLRLCGLLKGAFGSLTETPLDERARRATFAPVSDLRGRFEEEWITVQYDKIAAEARRIGANFAVLALPYRARSLRVGWLRKRLGRVPYDGLSRRDVSNDRGSRSDDRAIADVNSLENRRPDSHVRTATTANVASEVDPRTEMGARADFTVVIDRRTGVDDHEISDPAAGVNNGSGHQDAPLSDAHARRHDRILVHHGRKRSARIEHYLRQLAAKLWIADGDAELV